MNLNKIYTIYLNFNILITLFLLTIISTGTHAESEDVNQIRKELEELKSKVESNMENVHTEIGSIVEGLSVQLKMLENKIEKLQRPPAVPEPFLKSKVFSPSNKVFLHPLNIKERKGSWFQNMDICSKYDAEMVTIHTEAENIFFHEWARSPEIQMGHPGAWFGAQVFDKNKDFHWENGATVNYTNLASYEFNEDGITCLSCGWDNSQNWWYNWWCIDARLLVICQKHL